MPEIEELKSTEDSPTGRNPPPALDLTGGKPMNVVASRGSEDDDIDDDDLDETIGERLLGLTEMFPESVRNLTSSLASMSMAGSFVLYSLARSGLWVVASSVTILALPIMFESERAQMEEQQIQQQRQILLGPNAAAASSQAGLMAGMPPIPQPK